MPLQILLVTLGSIIALGNKGFLSDNEAGFWDPQAEQNAYHINDLLNLFGNQQFNTKTLLTKCTVETARVDEMHTLPTYISHKELFGSPTPNSTCNSSLFFHTTQIIPNKDIARALYGGNEKRIQETLEISFKSLKWAISSAGFDIRYQ
uniref:Secreted protein n=1 Tax=Heterorhabditis bacteriophora TaxID=37862 RepID=A0A1I7X0I3_HETBA